jgi:hypothetical protein
MSPPKVPTRFYTRRNPDRQSSELRVYPGGSGPTIQREEWVGDPRLFARIQARQLSAGVRTCETATIKLAASLVDYD